MKRYLITGVAGFIGSSLARTLLARGEQVRGLDDFSTGTRERLATLPPGLDFHEGSLNDAKVTAAACAGVDVILHEAALPSVARSVLDPLTSHRANIDGTLNLLLAARAAGVPRVVYAASSSAYGDTPTLPKVETMPPRPMSPYAVQKLAGEHYMQSFARVYGMDTVCLRYFNVFGPHQAANSPYSGVLAKFITQMLAGETPTIFGDGTHSRDFTYIDNVVAANLLAAEAPAERVSGKVYNIACGARASLLEIFDRLRQITGFTADPHFGPARLGDVPHSLADIAAAKADLGYEPRISLTEGLLRTVEWYREHR